MNTLRICITLAVCAAATMACDPSEAPMVETVNLNLAVENGVSLNGTSFAATPVSTIGTTVNDPFSSPFDAPIGAFPVWQIPSEPLPSINPFGGIGPNGNSLSGIQLEELKDLELDTGVAVGDLLGAEVEGRTTRGKKTKLVITGLAAGEGQTADLMYYVVHAADGNEWTPLCGTDGSGEPIAAIAVPGGWDHSQGTTNGGKWRGDRKSFNFACRGSSIAKCMEAGYKPWVDPASTQGNLSVRSVDQVETPNHLQACVRMIRADFCGDGESHTVNGRKVEFWDTMAMQVETQSWNFEAGWGPDGAVAVRDIRVDFEEGGPRCLTMKRFKDLRLGRLENAQASDLPNLHRQENIFILSSFERKLRLDD